MTEKIAASTARYLERRVGRRGFLVRSATVATAIAVAPVRYLFRPGSAMATVSCTYGDGCGNFYGCTCGSCSCSTSTCKTDGFTAFCCTQYGSNSCPNDTFIGGWWKCSSSSHCSGNARYYLDCNALCDQGGSGSGCQDCSNPPAGQKWCSQGDTCSYGCTSYRCHCANGNCDNRHSACTWFRYGQCNQDTHPCSGPVVCRIVSCTPPWQNHDCSSTSHQNDTTCSHNASCLP